MGTRTLHDRIVDAESMASRYLASGNLHAEAGRKAEAEMSYKRAQLFLDRANKLKGND